MLKPSGLLAISICAAGLLFAATLQTAAAADTPAGKTLTQQQGCANCHLPEDWKGNSEAQMQSKISAVVAGKHKHPKKLDLTQSQIADIAAYWTGPPQ